MEQIRLAVEALSAPTKTLSRNQQTSIENGKNANGPSSTEHAALFTVINKARLLNGWTTRTAQELDPTIRVWHQAFEDYNIPVSAYERLYRRCLDYKQMRLRDSNTRVDIDAVLMIAQWTGPHGLKAEMRDEEIKRARSLPETATSVCEKCHGTGFETLRRPDGSTHAIKCDHVWNRS